MKIQDPKGRLRTLWHITQRRSFRPDPGFTPFGFEIKKRPVVYATTNPHFWTHVMRWGQNRHWAAELDILPEHPPFDRENPVLYQVMLDPAFLEVRRVVPVTQAIAEMEMSEREIEESEEERERRIEDPMYGTMKAIKAMTTSPKKQRKLFEKLTGRRY
jgi:hypothetical protein